MKKQINIRPIRVADLLVAEDERTLVYVQRRELDDARSKDDYTIRDRVIRLNLFIS